MFTKFVAIITILAAFLAQACGHSTPLYLICLIDMSGSIELGEQPSQFDLLDPVFKQLRRGDSLVIIPITGDALNEAQGNILRFQLGTRREAYDADLRRLRTEIGEKLRLLKETVERSPYQQTDLLGASELCAEELATAPPNSRRLVVILSDFIQDDRRLNFTRDPRLASAERAGQLARDLAASKEPLFHLASVYLGFLRSSDLRKLPEPRRDALRSFWTEYLRARGAAEVFATTDGTGQVARFLERARSEDARKNLADEQAAD